MGCDAGKHILRAGHGDDRVDRLKVCAPCNVAAEERINVTAPVVVVGAGDLAVE